ncbi:MAG: hypothetical protein PHT12_02225 [Patescibacteria group bacterium]|nr:hypothetical protein [Patescibacteria group bacterium]
MMARKNSAEVKQKDYRHIILGVLLLAGIVFSVVTIVTATAPDPGHNFTESSGGVVQGDLLYGSAADTLLALPKDATATRYLSNTGTSNNPAWAQVALATGVSGTLPVGNGGTGTSTGSITGTGALTFTAGGTNQNVTLTPSGIGYTVLNGNVGIGDTTPASLFTVGSGDLFQVDSSGNLIKLNNITYSWPATQGAASTVLTNNGSGTLTWAAGGSGTVTGSGATGGVTFWTSSSALSADATKFYWDNTDKRLSIGTAVPKADLHVESPTGVTANFFLRKGGQASGYNFAVDNTKLYISSYDGTTYSDKLVIDTTGAIGIGTPNPAAGDATVKLDMYGNLRLSSGGSSGMTLSTNRDDNSLYLVAGTAFTKGASVQFYGETNPDYPGDIYMVSGGATVSPASTIEFGYRNSGGYSSLMTLKNTGNVGIGDTTPASLFTVGSGDKFQVTSGGLMSVNDNTTGPGNVQGMFANTHSAGRSQVIVSSGTYPNNFFALMTHSPSFASDNYLNDATSDAGLGILLGQGGQMTKFSVGTYNAAPLSLFTDNTERVYIAADGDVSIGTMTSDAKLRVEGGVISINGEGYGIVVDDNRTAAGGRVGLVKYPGLEGMLLAGNDAQIRIGHRTDQSGVTGGSPTIRVELLIDYGTGYIGIGDTTPASLLTVGDGDKFQINSTGNLIKVNNVTYSWPASQGVASTVLTNNGSGTLTWAATAGGTTMTTVVTRPVMATGAVAAVSLSSRTVYKVALFNVPYSMTVNQLTYNVGSVSTAGSYRICVYTEDGTSKLIDVTDTPTAGVNSVVVDGVALPPGNYYVAMGCNANCNNTVTMFTSTAATWINTSAVPAGKTVYEGTATMSSNGVCDTTLPAITGVVSSAPVIRLDN